MQIHIIIAEGFAAAATPELSAFGKACVQATHNLVTPADVVLVHNEQARNGDTTLGDAMYAFAISSGLVVEKLKTPSHDALTDARATFAWFANKQGEHQLVLMCYNPEVEAHQLWLYKRVLQYEFPELAQRIRVTSTAVPDVPAVRWQEKFLYQCTAAVWRWCMCKPLFKIATWGYSLTTRNRHKHFVRTFTPMGKRQA